MVNTNENLLGRPALTQLKLVKWKNESLAIETINKIAAEKEYAREIVQQYPEVFKGLGNLRNFEYKIELKDNAIPHSITVLRRVPIPLMKEVESQLNKMENDDVIERVEQPTEWCAPMVAQNKNRKVRICFDFTELNKFVKREVYQLPSVDETLSKLQESVVFTKLDFSKRFWQLNLNEKSQKYTTFLTPFGRFSYKRIPLGITSAPEIFQRTVNNIIAEVKSDRVIVHADDILIAGRNVEEHDELVHKVLTVLKNHGLTINKEKCHFRNTETTYLGFVVSAVGIRADPKSVDAIKQYPVPENIADVRQFLGMVNYMSRFIPKVADKTKSVRELLRKDNQFVWTIKQQTDFEKLKDDITSEQVLTKFSTLRKRECQRMHHPTGWVQY